MALHDWSSRSPRLSSRNSSFYAALQVVNDTPARSGKQDIPSSSERSFEPSITRELLLVGFRWLNKIYRYGLRSLGVSMNWLNIYPATIPDCSGFWQRRRSKLEDGDGTMQIAIAQKRLQRDQWAEYYDGKQVAWSVVKRGSPKPGRSLVFWQRRPLLDNSEHLTH